MVHATAPGDLEGGRRLADHRAGLVGRQRLACDELSQRRTVDLLGHDVAGVAVRADVEDADQAGVGDQGRSSGRIQRRSGTCGGHDPQDDRPDQDLVDRVPVGGAGQGGGPCSVSW